MIAIVDYGRGNLRSVEKGLLHVGADARVTSDAKSLDDAQAIVLPGVGAFADCMDNLREADMVEAVIRNIKKGKPFLGICLGLQLLFTNSEEFGRTEGLNIFKGTVPRFPKGELKVPHMGWNSINIQNRPPILKDVEDGSYFFFVHSYYVAPEDPSIVAATTDYGIQFPSIIWKDNVFATQFHPEKSQTVGLKVLKGFNEFVEKN